MPSYESEHIETYTAEQIRKAQQELHSWEISEAEYDEKYESIMQNYRLRTEQIFQESWFWF